MPSGHDYTSGRISTRSRSDQPVAGTSLLNLLFVPLEAILLSLFHSGTSKAQINHGSFTGVTVDYIDVTERSITGDAVPLFGAPSVFSRLG